MLRLLIILFFSNTLFASVPPITATVFSAKSENLFDVLTYPVRIDPEVNAQVFSEYDGLVAVITKALGAEVRPNERLMLVKHTDPVYQYRPINIVSPVRGVVSAIKVTEGTRVTKGQLVATVTDPKKVKAMFEVAALDIPFFQAGVSGELTISGMDQKISVRVNGVSPFVDPSTGTATGELEILGKTNLAPGLIGRAEFKVNQRTGYSVPEQAIFYRGTTPYLRTVIEGKAAAVAVTLGKKQRGQVEILKGLKDGDVIVERASGFLADGDTVTTQTK